jgi:hypothetical protein
VSLKDENPVGTAFKILRMSRPERSKLALAVEGRDRIPRLRNGCKCLPQKKWCIDKPFLMGEVFEAMESRRENRKRWIDKGFKEA